MVVREKGEIISEEVESSDAQGPKEEKAFSLESILCENSIGNVLNTTLPSHHMPRFNLKILIFIFTFYHKLII